MTPTRVLEVLRENPTSRTRVVYQETPEPMDGEIMFTVDRFGLAANNVSYALLGDELGHWRPFPGVDPAWGRVPAWGLMTVVAADPAVAEEGARYLGYVPMATHMLSCAAPASRGLIDTSAERENMLPFYRDLFRVDDDADWSDDHADAEVVMLPVHPAAALLDEYLNRLPARSVVISSATSKTALATGRLLRDRGVVVTGLTGASGVAAATAVGVYDDVLPYEQVVRMPRRRGTVYVDVAGLPEITEAVHSHLADHLVRSVAVGGSHLSEVNVVSASTGPAPRSGPPVERFSVGRRQVELAAEVGSEAVAQIEQRARRILVAWAAEKLTIRALSGVDEAEKAWLELTSDRPAPLEALVISP